MHHPLVSIVVPVYNTEQYLQQCLDSLVNQTYRNIEIICVNDSSPDNSQSLLNDYADRDPRVKVYCKPNGGLSDTRNFGMRYISGDYFMFIDSDDWLELNAIEESIRTITNEDADCLMFGYIKEFADSSVPVSPLGKTDLCWKGAEVRKNLLRRTFGPVGSELNRPQDCDITVSACMQLFRSAEFREILFYDNRKLGTFEDGIYQIDVFSRCNHFCYIDKPFYHYRKTNIASITTKHNPQLPQRWKKLFEVLNDKAREYAVNSEEISEIHEAIDNRIAVAILPLGLNEVRAQKPMKQKTLAIADIVNDPVYSIPLAKLNIRQLPLPWKIFFTLAKNKLFSPLALMLSLIEYARTHYQK